MLGAVLDAALTAGATDIGALHFGRLDARPGQLRALADAVKDARARVDAMAQALGVRITRVVEVRTLEDGGARPVMQVAMYRSGLPSRWSPACSPCQRASCSGPSSRERPLAAGCARAPD